MIAGAKTMTGRNQIRRVRHLVAAALMALTLLAGGCGGVEHASPMVNQGMINGDRQREWGLVFFQSWRRDRNGKYLNLSRGHMVKAVKTYFDLQVAIGHSYPDFYILDRRRRQGCRFLGEVRRIANKFRVKLDDQPVSGCFTPT